VPCVVAAVAVRRNKRPGRPKSLRIYEAHVGMAGEDERVSTYAEFRDQVLPRIKQQGYTAIQLMAIQVCAANNSQQQVLACLAGHAVCLLIFLIYFLAYPS